MAEFFAELKRRHLYRVGAAYVVAAWVLTQVVDVLSQVFELPSWIAQPAVVLLALGLPVALIAAWIIEGRPHEAVASAVRSKSTSVDWLLFGAVTVLIAVTGYQQLARPSGPPSTLAPTTDLSVAVLPFANLSGDVSQEFFSDGMTEEITAALARVPNLRVVGRTSAFQFKGQTKDFAAIRQALGVAYLIDGSVRRDGDRVRITAQLVQADGTNIWTESYDRQLTSVFATQEDIARAIAGALRAPLGLQQGERLISNRTGASESYDQYLRARSLRRSGGTDIVQAIDILERVVASEPSFAPAWALLARSYQGVSVSAYEGRTGSQQGPTRRAVGLVDKAEGAAREALRLDPANAVGYTALADAQADRGQWAAADDLYRKAQALDPNEPEFLFSYGQALRAIGRLKEALSVTDRLRVLEPLVDTYTQDFARNLQLNGQNQAAIPILEALLADSAGSVGRNVELARAYAFEGRLGEAAETLLATRADLVSRQSMEEAARILRSAPTRVGTAGSLPLLEGSLSFVYSYVGADERFMDVLERDRDAQGDRVTLGARLWHPLYTSLRKSERLKAFVRSIGLVDYWRARGWPDLCRPVGADDFECE